MRTPFDGIATARLAGLGVLIITTAAAGASAQRSNFGTVSLTPGFMPDPHSTQGTSGGQSEARRLNASCRGWIASNPDHVFNVTRAFAFLRVFAVADQDTTLVIQTPDGQLRCDDDTYGRNPSVEGAWPAGTYRIWVGSYTHGTNSAYRLYFSELPGTTPSTVGGGSNVQVAPPPPPATAPQPETPVSTATRRGARRLDTSGARSNFQGAWLQAGFTPDPHVLTGTSGGNVQARRVANGCSGFIARRPDHVLNLEGNYDFFRISVASAQDTTLVVRRPDGSFLCNDDSHGNDPEVRRNRWQPGMYLVWVGSYRQGERGDYRISFSELGGGGAPAAPVAQQDTGGQLDVSGTRSNFRDARLRTGFTPDPQRLTGTSGGSISARNLGPDCRGYIARQPDHILYLQSSTNFFRIFATSNSDTTLVVRSPDGRWFCDDDTNGRNPALEGEFWNAGRYLIWVGSYNQGENAPYTLGFTELRGVTR